MNYISDSQIIDLNLSAEEKLEWVETCLRHKAEYDLPAKISIKKTGNIFYNTMPTVMEPIDLAGVKCVNRYPGRNPALESTIMLYRYSTGLLESLLDGNEITAMRTGAVAVHSASLFANPEFEVVSMIGLGNIMKHTADIFFEKYKDKTMTIKLYNYKNIATKFAEKYNKYYNLNFIFCDTYHDTFAESDLIFSAVSYAENDFCKASVYKNGCTIIPIHTRGFMDCDLSFDKIYGDDTAHLHDFKYFNQFKFFAEVSDVITNTKEGRVSKDERILVYNIGLAIHDMYYAKRILEKLS